MKKKKKMMISERKERKGKRVERREKEREGQRGNLCQRGVWRRFVAERERERV